MIYQNRSTRGSLALLWITMVCGIFSFAVLDATSAPDSKEIKKLAKSFRKAVQGDNADNAIDIARQIAAYGTEDAVETLYDLGFKDGRNPTVYSTICEELSRMDGCVDFISERYTKLRSKSDFRERVYLTDILSFPTNKRGKINDEIMKLGKQLQDIENDGLPPGADFAAALVDGLCAKFAMAPPADLARVPGPAPSKAVRTDM